MLRLFLLRKLEIELCINRVANLFIYWKWALSCISVNTIIKQKEGISLLFIPSLLFTSQHFTQKSMNCFPSVFLFFSSSQGLTTKTHLTTLGFLQWSLLALVVSQLHCLHTVLSSPHPDIPYPLISAPSKALTVIQLIPDLQCILCHSQLSLSL